jgi:hypothetical protein
MTHRFRIVDEIHDEPAEGEFATFATALAEVRRLVSIPWGEEPNVAPCQSWRTCGRHYEIVEFDEGWVERNRTSIVEITHNEVKWEYKGAVDAK